MKMKRIANNVALQTIGYVISGFTNVYIYVRECGYQKRDIYRGLYTAIIPHTPQAEILP